jgi:dTMP kinase
MKASYICFEGIDGAGKTSQIGLLVDWLTRSDVTPIVLCEPSYGPYGREARTRMVEGTIGDLAAQRALFTLDRRDHVARKIEPALRLVRGNPGFAIVQSRSYLSSPAYQSDSLDPAVLAAAAAAERQNAPLPDIILLLDIPVDEALVRLKKDRRPDMFEAKELLEKVAQRYRYLAQITPNCVVIDAVGAQAVVAARTRTAIESFGGVPTT